MDEVSASFFKRDALSRLDRDESAFFCVFPWIIPKVSFPRMTFIDLLEWLNESERKQWIRQLKTFLICAPQDLIKEFAESFEFADYQPIPQLKKQILYRAAEVMWKWRLQDNEH